MSPVWLPDGRNIAYVSFKKGNSLLVIQTLDNGTISKVISFPQHNGAPTISQDGSKLAFASSKIGSLNIYVMDLISGNINQITHERSNNTEPSWFLDNHTIAYTLDQCGNPQIYKINLTQGHSQRLSWKGSKNQNANVSIDGKFLVLVHSDHGSIQHITKLNLKNGDIQALTDSFLDETPSLAPNGTMIIYSSASQKLGSSLQIVSTNGYFKRCILTITTGRLTGPTWSPI